MRTMNELSGENRVLKSKNENLLTLLKAVRAERDAALQNIENLKTVVSNLLGNYPGPSPKPGSIWSECVSDARKILDSTGECVDEK
jgi:hypothetical protein